MLTCIVLIVASLLVLALCVVAFQRSLVLDRFGDWLDERASLFTGVAIIAAVTCAMSIGSFIALWLAQ